MRHTGTLTVVTVITILTHAATAAVVLYDDFAGSGVGVGDGTSVNGGFQLVSNNSNGTGAIVENGGNAEITTAANSFDNTGMVSINGFDASVATSISATWVVAGQTTPGSLNDTELLLQGGTSNNSGDGTGFRTGPNIIFSVNAGGNGWQLTGNDGTGVTLGSGGFGTNAGVADGYSLTLNLSATGWGLSSSGFTSNISLSNQAYAGTFDFSDLQTTLYAAAMIQANNQNTARFLNVDSISVDVVPEPSSATLIILGLAGVILLRRRQCQN